MFEDYLFCGTIINIAKSHSKITDSKDSIKMSVTIEHCGDLMDSGS